MSNYFTLSILSFYLYNKIKEIRRKKKLTSDDNCNSLFYSNNYNNNSNNSNNNSSNNNINKNGNGFPYLNTNITINEINKLKEVKKEYIKLSKELYFNIVRYLPTVCVDVILKRKSDNKLLLFYRRDKPAANIWWWPGGRMLKGETFFDAASRKIREETGNKTHIITPKHVLKVWNTFFPDSSWDEGRDEDEKGCQTVNITVLCEVNDSEQFTFDTKTSKEWAVEAHRWISIDEGLVPGNYDKYVRLTIEDALERGLLIR